MHFVFINPPREIKGNNIWSIINSVNPPLGLALLAAIWDKHGHTSQIIDASALRLSIPEIIAGINPSADYVGITATTPEIGCATAIARKVREKFPHVEIIMGGTHPTIFHEELVRNKICDLVVRNEGEIPIARLAVNAPHEAIPNLTWRDSSDKVIINPDSQKFVNLDDLPFPAYEKLPMPLYHSALGAARKEPSIGMVTSRGCPGKCTFCFSEMFGSQIRLMSPDRIIQHIEHLQNNFGIREISFYDDTFTAGRENVAQLCRLMIEKNIRLSWSCFARVDTVAPDLLLLMKKAGCHQIMYGFETTDEKILKHINKRTNPNQFQNAIAWTRAAKINVRGAFMLGNPGETKASMEKTIAFAKKSEIQLAVFNITTPYPGTALFKEFSQNDSLLHQNWDLYNLAQPVLKLNTVSAESVRQYYYKSYRDFYLRPSFILRRILAIRTFPEVLMYARAVFNIMTLPYRNISFNKDCRKK
ncbi:MAG: B12-binding domain-containing radical SAM protein [Deltaproteobacteria bacterium]|nr:B12-binding domain-containing radical SAM protein [Deltaproteobacteria bacterium]